MQIVIYILRSDHVPYLGFTEKGRMSNMRNGEVKDNAMAYTRIVFQNPNTGHIKVTPVGFSWTVLFFNFFPPLLRGDRKWGIIMFLLALLTSGASALIFMFIYNKLYIKDLIISGFKAKSVETGTIYEVSRKLGVTLPVLDRA